MVNDDILLQKNAAVCTSTGVWNWMGDIAKLSRLCQGSLQVPWTVLCGAILSPWSYLICNITSWLWDSAWKLGPCHRQNTKERRLFICCILNLAGFEFSTDIWNTGMSTHHNCHQGCWYDNILFYFIFTQNNKILLNISGKLWNLDRGILFFLA